MSIWNKLFGEAAPDRAPAEPAAEATETQEPVPTTPEELRRFITSTAGASDADVSNVRFMLDPGSTTSGSLRLTMSNEVHDLSFDLSTPAGAQAAKDKVLSIIG
ncbi:hypothetical protein [Corynebacterium testudinoris]|uniref:Uncharacterized protein n=2 Tax=Corynebacterium testudinoris TaxID=136857 RepID=A0A0G3HDT7_9CORY|nr:hypothetical protein [Corynebacterium testudinoris]AKK09297.1 hypothetical protein CTEST_09345 [Corynebacterium testudinoris]